VVRKIVTGRRGGAREVGKGYEVTKGGNKRFGKGRESDGGW